MKLIYYDSKTEEICKNINKATRFFGGNKNMALSLFSRINALVNAENLKDISRFPQYRMHQLKGNRKNQYSITILKSSKYRLILYPLDEDESVLESLDNEMLMLVKCVCIKIEEVSEHYE